MKCFNKMWKINNNAKRQIKEVELSNINLNEYIIIDVRSKREFREGHLPGAINVPLSEISKNIENYINNKQNKILVCCEYGVRSQKAIAIIERLGYTKVYNLKGGLENI